jgi:hypothetical protein
MSPRVIKYLRKDSDSSEIIQEETDFFSRKNHDDFRLRFFLSR